MVILTHSRDGKLISRQVVSGDNLDADEMINQAAELLFEMVYQEKDETQSA